MSQVTTPTEPGWLPDPSGRYEWRYWSIVEVRDALHDAGFEHVDSYFEQTDRPDGEGNGKFKLDQRGSSGRDCIGLVAYLVARG